MKPDTIYPDNRMVQHKGSTIAVTVTVACQRCGQKNSFEFSLYDAFDKEDLAEIRHALKIRGDGSGDIRVLCDECDKQLIAVRQEAAAMREKMMSAFWMPINVLKEN